MGRVLTNQTGLQVALETGAGVLPGSPVWYLLERNTLPRFGAQLTTVERNPVSKNRQRRKSLVVGLDSAVEFETDLTYAFSALMLERAVMATFANPTIIRHLQAGASFNSLAADNDPPPAGTDSGYTHSALSGAIPAGTLVFARGFTNAINNGMKEAITGSTTTATLIATDVLIDETPAQTTGASLDVAGFRGATADLTWTNATKTLGSTVLNFTTLGLTVGQQVHVGGLTSTNQFTGGTLSGRVQSISATALVLARTYGTLAGDDAGTGKRIDLLYGRFVRNVPVDHANFSEQYLQFEASYPNLENPSGDAYEYAIGKLLNTLEISSQLRDKVTLSSAFVGLDTEIPTTTRKTNAATPVLPVGTEGYNTAADFGVLSLVEGSTELFDCLKNITLRFNHNVTPEECLGTFGATYLNFGNFLVDIEAQALFTEKAIVAAIRNNATLSFSAVWQNADGGIAVDIPSLTLGGGGDKEFPENESVRINLQGGAFEDPVLGTSVGITLFPALP